MILDKHFKCLVPFLKFILVLGLTCHSLSFFFFHLKSQESNSDVFSGRPPGCQDHPVFSGRCLFPYGEKISRHPCVLFPWPAPPMTHSWGFHLRFIQVPAQMSLHQRGAPLHTHSVQNSILVTLSSASARIYHSTHYITYLPIYLFTVCLSHRNSSSV